MLLKTARIAGNKSLSTYSLETGAFVNEYFIILIYQTYTLNAGALKDQEFL